MDFGTDTVLDKLVGLVVEPGDTVRVERSGREVVRLDALPGVVVEVTARLPRLGSPAGSLPSPALEERTAVERLGDVAPAAASGKPK